MPACARPTRELNYVNYISSYVSSLITGCRYISPYVNSLSTGYHLQKFAVCNMQTSSKYPADVHLNTDISSPRMTYVSNYIDLDAVSDNRRELSRFIVYQMLSVTAAATFWTETKGKYIHK